MEEKKFWMCYAEGRNTPVRKHETYEIAKEEAYRLSEKTGCTVYILEATQKVSTKTFTETKIEELTSTWKISLSSPSTDFRDNCQQFFEK